MGSGPFHDAFSEHILGNVGEQSPLLVLLPPAARISCANIKAAKRSILQMKGTSVA